MNVASLELCKELYELSRWTCGQWWIASHKNDGSWNLSDDKTIYHSLSKKSDRLFPAYDLGYLLRKLPDPILDTTVYGKWHCKWAKRTKAGLTGPMKDSGYADSPEDAACKLAIELFKNGVLTK